MKRKLRSRVWRMGADKSEVLQSGLQLPHKHADETEDGARWGKVASQACEQNWTRKGERVDPMAIWGGRWSLRRGRTDDTRA